MSSLDKIRTLYKKHQLYQALAPTVQKDAGFIESEHCDSLLFSALYGIAVPIEIEAARNADGQWFRRPINLPECYAAGESHSTISRDMLIGVLWYIWKHERLDLAEDLDDYGKKHGWLMGDGNQYTLYFTPNLQATLAEIIAKLGGPKHQIRRSMPQVYTRLNTGYQAHLDVLVILLRGELRGNITGLFSRFWVGRLIKRGWQELFKPLIRIIPGKNGKIGVDTLVSLNEPIDVVKTQYKRDPKNPLISYAYHKYVTGDYNVVIGLLLDEKIWPSDRLPTSQDRRESWYQQRDSYDGANQPASAESEIITHSGGDFLFISRLLLEDLGMLP